MTDNAERCRQSSPWTGSDFVLPVLVLMPAADLAAIYGHEAAQLGITGASLVQASPAIMLVVAVFCPWVLFRTCFAAYRHAITTVLIFGCVIAAPMLLEFTSSSIRLARLMTQEEREVLTGKFDLPTVLYSGSAEGVRLRVRRSDDTAGLRAYLSEVGVLADSNP